MKSEIIQEQPEDTTIEYPCLMQHYKLKFVVLFINSTTGTVVALMEEDCSWPVGYHSAAWYASSFKPFKGKLVLSND